MPAPPHLRVAAGVGPRGTFRQRAAKLSACKMDAPGLQLRPPAADAPADPALEVERLASLLAGRRAELSAL